MSKDKSPKALGKGTIIAIVIGSVVVVALVAVIIVMAIMLGKKNSNTTDNPPKRNVVVTPENVQDVIEQAKKDEYVTPGSFEVNMNTEWYFKDGTSASSNAYVGNAAGNTNDVYFDITLEDTEELIYSSPVIPLGSHLENITLDKELKNGTYNCILKYTLVDEDQNPVSDLNVKVVIVIGMESK